MQESLTDGTGEKQKPKAEGRKTNWKAKKAPRWGGKGSSRRSLSQEVSDLTGVFITSVNRMGGTSLCALELLAHTSALCVARLEALSVLRGGGSVWMCCSRKLLNYCSNLRSLEEL